MGLLVRPLREVGRKSWLAAQREAHIGDSTFIAPISSLELDRINPRKAPFFRYGEAEFFVALRDGRPVGRISAQVNRDHLAFAKDGTGHFGFFDVCDDPEAAKALVETARAWLGARGMSRMVGPFNLSTNEEIGCLVSGFDLPPAFMMPHARMWTGALLEQAGLTKAVDVFAYRLPAEAAKAAAAKAARLAAPVDLEIKPFDVRRLQQSIATMAEVYNDAWSENWGFVPMGSADIDHFAQSMRPIARPQYGCLVYVGGEPVAAMVALPNLNEAFAEYGGSLGLVNSLKLLWRLRQEQFRSGRILILGIKRAHQGGLTGATILGSMLRWFLEQHATRKLDWLELSWVLETNRPMNALARFAGAKAVKTYRLFEAPLSNSGASVGR